MSIKPIKEENVFREALRDEIWYPYFNLTFFSVGSLMPFFDKCDES